MTISGAVKRPGDYELIATKDLKELFEVAGGFRPDADDDAAAARDRARRQGARALEISIPFGADGALPAASSTIETRSSSRASPSFSVPSYSSVPSPARLPRPTR